MDREFRNTIIRRLCLNMVVRPHLRYAFFFFSLPGSYLFGYGSAPIFVACLLFTGLHCCLDRARPVIHWGFPFCYMLGLCQQFFLELRLPWLHLITLHLWEQTVVATLVVWQALLLPLFDFTVFVVLCISGAPELLLCKYRQQFQVPLYFSFRAHCYPNVCSWVTHHTSGGAFPSPFHEPNDGSRRIPARTCRGRRDTGAAGLSWRTRGPDDRQPVPRPVRPRILRRRYATEARAESLQLASRQRVRQVHETEDPVQGEWATRDSGGATQNDDGQKCWSRSPRPSRRRCRPALHQATGLISRLLPVWGDGAFQMGLPQIQGRWSQQKTGN